MVRRAASPRLARAARRSTECGLLWQLARRRKSVIKTSRLFRSFVRTKRKQNKTTAKRRNDDTADRRTIVWRIVWCFVGINCSNCVELHIHFCQIASQHTARRRVDCDERHCASGDRSTARGVSLGTAARQSHYSGASVSTERLRATPWRAAAAVVFFFRPARARRRACCRLQYTLIHRQTSLARNRHLLGAHGAPIALEFDELISRVPVSAQCAAPLLFFMCGRCY